MMTFYAAAGSYQIRSEDGKNMPYIMRLGKLQPVSIPEFSLWSMLLWDVLTYEELHKKFYDKMEETEIEPSSFDKSLEMLVKRKLIIKGVGYTGADALYNMLSDTYVIPLRGVQGTRKLMNVAKLLKQKKVNFFEAVYLLQPEKSSVAERRIMNLVLQTLEITDRVVVCVNLMDEAEKKQIEDKLADMKDYTTCPQCGYRVARGLAYCPKCGEKLAK